MCFGVECGIERVTSGCIFDYENYWEWKPIFLMKCYHFYYFTKC